MDYSPEHFTNSERGWDFEDQVSNVLREFGWDVLQTPRSNDFGADIIAEFQKDRLAIQCKFYSGYIGRKAIQEVLYAKLHYKATRTMIIFEGSISDAIRVEGATHGVEFARLSELLPNHSLDVSEQARRNRRALEVELNRQRELVEIEKRKREREIALEAEAKLKVANEKVVYLFENFPSLLRESTDFNAELARTSVSRSVKKFEDSLNLLEIILLVISWPLLIFGVLLGLSFAVDWPYPSSEIGDIRPLLFFNALTLLFFVTKYLKASANTDDYKKLPVCPSELDYQEAKRQLKNAAEIQEVLKRYTRSHEEILDSQTVKGQTSHSAAPSQASGDNTFLLRVAETSLAPMTNQERYKIVSDDRLNEGPLEAPKKSRKFKCVECSSSLTVKTPDALRFRCPKCKTVAGLPLGLWE